MLLYGSSWSLLGSTYPSGFDSILLGSMEARTK